MVWAADELATAVRSVLMSYPPTFWTFETVEIDEDGLLLIFTVDAAAPVRPPHDLTTRFGVRYPLTDLPEGPSTGVPCHTAEEWASEIRVDMDENILTGGVGRAEHLPGPDGVVLLRWRH